MSAWEKKELISEKATIHPNVEFGKNVIVEDFCEIGVPPRGKKPGELKTKIGDNAHIRSQTTIYADNEIGKNFQTGNKVNIRESNIIGDDVSIGTLSIVEHHVKLEDGVRCHSQVFVPEYSILRKGCWLGPNVVLTNAKYPNRPETKNQLEGPVIEEEAVIGANATILPGVIVGQNSIVGAGAVVTKNVAPETKVIGNPARKIP